jgi:hypothetical protein
LIDLMINQLIFGQVSLEAAAPTVSNFYLIPLSKTGAPILE